LAFQVFSRCVDASQLKFKIYLQASPRTLRNSADEFHRGKEEKIFVPNNKKGKLDTDKIISDEYIIDRLCGIVFRVLGYRSGGPGSIPGTTM
jgi:hypothetical protein